MASGELFGEIVSIARLPSQISLISNGMYYEGKWAEDVLCVANLQIRVLAIQTERGFLIHGRRCTLGGLPEPLYSDRAMLHLTVFKIEEFLP